MVDTDLKSSKPGAVPFAMAFVVVALVLLSQMGAETKFSARGSLVAQPRFWPAVGVFGMVGFGIAHLFSTWRARTGTHMREVLIWARSVEYFLWFMAYVYAAPLIGYLAATLIFTVLLGLRQGYRGRMLVWAAFLGLVTVLIFKTGLGVKIPGGAIYEYLPSALRNFMIVNF